MADDLPITDLPATGKLMGLDLGTKTIGVAISDAMRYSATPVETIKRTKFTQDAARIVELVEQNQVVAIVLGLPLNMDGSSGPRAQASRAFARNLADALALPVLLWDERWSTTSAERAMIDQDFSRSKRAERIDSHAAAVILQAAIDRLDGGVL